MPLKIWGDDYRMRFKNHEKRKIDGSHITSVVRGKQYRTHGWWFCNADSTAIEKTRSKFGDKIAEKVKKLMQEL